MDNNSSDSKTVQQRLHVPTIHDIHVVVVEPAQKHAQKVTNILQKQGKNLFSPAFVLLSHKSNALEEVAVGQDTDSASTASGATQDKQLDSMELILNRKLQGVSIQQWHETCWSEVGINAGFYERWLVESGKLNVCVGPWETCNDSFCGEMYTQKRIVSFSFDRTTHLYTGPPRADVQQTHYSRLEGNNRCIVSIKIEMQGIPFADAFHVQLRWVATRLSDCAISVKIGLFVVFTKKILVAGKIRGATTTETRKSQQSLFNMMKETFGQYYEEEDEENGEQAQETNPCMIFLHDLFKKPTKFFTFCSPGSQPRNYVDDDMDDVDRELIQIHGKLKLIKVLPLTTSSERHMEESEYVHTELQTAILALDEIILRIPSCRSLESAATQQSAMHQIAAAALAPLTSTWNHLNSMGNKVQATIFGDKERSENQVSVRSRRVGFRLKPSYSDRQLLRASPDEFLPSMSIILDKTLKNTNVKSVYKHCFSQRSKMFYQSWLECAGGHEVSISDWMSSGGEEDLVSEWSKEGFDQKRILQYKFKRHALLHFGPLESKVMCTQWCRLEDNKLVLENSYQTRDIPFEDAFTVQVRWVFGNKLPLDGVVTVQVGLFVVFTKKSLMEGKIRSGATQEATRQQSSLYRRIKIELSRLNALEGIEDNQEDSTTLDSSKHSVQLEPLATSTEHELTNKLRLLEQKLSCVESAFENDDERAKHGMANYSVEQLNIVHQALDNLVSYLAHEDGETDSMTPARFLPNLDES